MQQIWRTEIKEYIENRYIHKPDEWFSLNVSTGGTINIAIVSDAFADEPLFQRREHIQKELSQFHIPLSIGFLSIYTIQEADTIGLSRPPLVDDSEVYSWYDLASWAMNANEQTKQQFRTPRVPRTIAFYSFKGGVGRTTALAHVAAILALRGRKVVAVDLDLEAPGLSSAFGLHALPKYGIVDYFYERASMPVNEDSEYRISIAEIFGEVTIPDATGRLFVVPAGTLDLEYITKVDDLRSTAVTAPGEDLWAGFFREIKEQLQPDIILVDARTGINEWGAFSLLHAADKAIVFLYPNEQNRQGIDLILTALAGKIPLQLVFSPVPFGEAGLEKVKEHWQVLQTHLDTFARSGESEELPPDIDAEYQTEAIEPITIQYLTELALASEYPVLPLLSHYMSIANVVDEDTNAINLETVLADTSTRWNIIKSLKFPEVDAIRNQNFGNLFQRTNDFDRFLDTTTCLIRGRKGTGKTALYTLLLKHTEEAKRLSRKRLDAVRCFSGHGSFRIRPEKDEFRLLDQYIEQHRISWEAFWRSYLFLRMQQENVLQRFFRSKDSKHQKVRSVLSKIPAASDHWQKEYTDTLIDMLKDVELNLLLKDALDDINQQLEKSKEQEVLWFLYDDLDVDFHEENELRRKALTGLFQFVQACDARQLKFIGFKIFLREDIWHRLVFDNKSHFNGRDIALRWTRLDFLRLALRQAQQAKEFADLVDRFCPIENIDQADEGTVDRALQLLWGSRREQNLKSKNVSRWVYERLTDSSGTTFPRSLNNLLKIAKEYELNTYLGQQSPTDRLLRPKSLIEGLFGASEQRCHELREEYSELIPFLDSLEGLNILTPRPELHKVWQRTVQNVLPEFKDFKKFVDFLLNIGLINLAELQGKKQGYRFAEIYTHGFKIYRGTRKY